MRTILAALFAFSLVGPAMAHDGIHVENAYARVAMASAETAAVFMELVNHSTEGDRLLAVQADVAARAELHTHAMSAEGMMQMLPVDEGFAVDGSGTRALARGGDHVMLMGLTQPLAVGDRFTLTLTFERSGKVVVVVPVRNDDPVAGIVDHSGHGAAPANE
jgi:periplasmic copper chaperone A